MNEDNRTNIRLKYYPKKTVLQIASTAIFPCSSEKPVEYKSPKTRENDAGSNSVKRTSKNPERAALVARERAKSAIRDIALCNNFETMATLTFDGEKIDRYSSAEIKKALKSTLSNLTQRHGIQYLVIPEYHKKKKEEETPAIHLHGLFVLGDLELVPAMKNGYQLHDSNGRLIYNLPYWDLRFGYNEVKFLDTNVERATNYIIKYITKDTKKIFGKYYWSSRSLQKAPKTIPLPSMADYYRFRDIDKLAAYKQTETNLYNDVFLLSETIFNADEEEAEDDP